MATKKATKSTAAKSGKTTSAVRTPRTKSAPRQNKPVFRTGTWVTVLLLAAAVSAAVYMNRQAEEAANAEPTPAEEAAFLFEQGALVTGIEVKPADGDPVALERNEGKIWVLTKPDKVEADPGAAEAAASQVGALSIAAEIDSQKDPSIFGLAAPSYTITVTLEGGKTSVLEVGDSTPSETGYYVRVDGEKMYVVTSSGIDALVSLSFLPPYLNTPTPVPTFTATPLPSTTPEATPTP